jgi:hypothetical protein
MYALALPHDKPNVGGLWQWGWIGVGRCDVYLQLMLAVLSSLLGPLQGPEGLAPV